MKLDISKLKKVHSDANSTTLQHAKGHKVMIAHKGLTKDGRKQLDAIPMSDGGQAGYIEDSDRLAQPAPAQQPTTPTNTTPQTHGTATKTYDQALHDLSSSGYAKGGQVPDFSKVKNSNQKLRPQMLSDAGDVKKEDGSSAITPEDVDVASQGSGNALNDMMNANGMSTDAQTNMTPSAPSQPYTPSGDTSSPKLAQPEPMGVQTPMPDMTAINNAVAQQNTGIQNEANAQSGLAQQQAAIADKQIQSTNAQAATYKQTSDALLKERQAVLEDSMKDKIDPNHFWDSKDSAGKVATAVGLLLGGLGGPHGNDWYQRAVANDIDAQKTNMGHKQNMLSALTQQLGDTNSAAQMLHIIKNDNINAQFQKAAALSNDPMVQARAQQLIAKNNIDSAMRLQPLQMSVWATNALNKGQITPAQAVPFKVPKEERAQALKEVGEQEQINNSSDALENAMKNVEKLQGWGSRLWNPIQAPSQISAYNLNVDQMGKEMFGKLNERELDMLANSHIGPLDNHKTAAVKIDNLRTIMQNHAVSPTLEAYGIRMPRHNQKFNSR